MSEKKHLRVYIPRIIAGLLAALAIFYLVKVIKEFIDEKPVKHDKKIQAITLLKPPPPPPPPPKVEKPPEPEVKEKIKELEPDPEPEQKPDESPPDDKPPGDEGIQGQEGQDAFGQKHGNSLGGGGKGGNPYAWYGGLTKKAVNAILNNSEELRHKSYTAIIKVWTNPDGSVEKVELEEGSGDAEIDKVLNRLLSKLKNLGEPTPPGMKRTLRLKISDRI